MYPAPHGQNDRVNTLDKDPAMKCQHVLNCYFYSQSHVALWSAWNTQIMGIETALGLRACL